MGLLLDMGLGLDSSVSGMSWTATFREGEGSQGHDVWTLVRYMFPIFQLLGSGWSVLFSARKFLMQRSKNPGSLITGAYLPGIIGLFLVRYSYRHCTENFLVLL